MVTNSNENIMTTTTNKTHGLFYSLIRQLDGYNVKDRDMIKEELVSSYSGGRTSSLSEMYRKYPARYAEMIERLKVLTRRTPAHRSHNDPEGDKWRKRVIASICGWMDRSGIAGYEDKVRYAKSVACRAASCADFNRIPTSRLQEVYSAFLKRSDVHYGRVALAQEQLDEKVGRMIDVITGIGRDRNLN